MNHGMRCQTALFMLLLTAGVSAQDFGPVLLCTRSEAGGEILTWENGPLDCGPGTYLGTEIYRSTSFTGPYERIATLTDSTITEYRDENPTGQRLFYYLAYETSCIDGEVGSSDTLDSFIPETPLLRFLSVEENDLVLSWQASASPEVTGYVILEVTPAGITAIDTVGEVTTYRITDVPTAELTTRQYRIAAIDPCGNDSPQSRIVSATGLTGSGGEGCNERIFLAPVGTASSEALGTVRDSMPRLFVSVNGGPYNERSYALSDLNAVDYGGGNDGETLCFYLQTNFTEGDSVRTAVFCRDLDISQPVRPFRLYGAELTDDGGIRLPFENNGIQVEPDSYSAEVEGTGVGEESYFDLVNELFSRREWLFPLFEPIEVNDSILLQTIDSCGRVFRTNAVRPVFLRVTAGGNGTPVLDWTPFVNGLEGALSYEVLRIDSSGGTEQLAGGLTNLTFTDIDRADRGGCYRIRANFTPADQDTTYAFLSNLACLAGNTEVYVPNVFSPTATQEVNREFRPFFSNNAAVRDYQLRLFDRWGGLYFETDDPSRGWNGTLGGQRAPTGAYVYTLSYREAEGNLIRRTGVVTLLR